MIGNFGVAGEFRELGDLGVSGEIIEMETQSGSYGSGGFHLQNKIAVIELFIHEKRVIKKDLEIDTVGIYECG